MFKSKSKSNGMNIVKDSFMSGSSILSHKIADGMKYAESQMENIGEIIRKNPNIHSMKMQIEKKPLGSALTVFGLGVTIFGIYKLLKK